MIYFLILLRSSAPMNNLYRRLEEPVVDRLQRLSYTKLFEQTIVPSGAYIFTGLDRLSGAQKLAAAQIWESLRESGCVLLNHPKRSLDRIDLLSSLYSLGYNEFRAFRAAEFEETEANYPVFVRANSKHTGPLSDLLYSGSEVDSALRKARWWGHSQDDLLIVEYCHTRDEDGYFRKYSAFRIGDRIIPCYLEHALHWSVKRSHSIPKAGSPEMADEELRFVEENPHETELKRIFDISQIQYGRIDYGVRNGRLQVWEINSAPSFGHAHRRANPARLQERQARASARALFYSCIGDALDALDAGVEPGEIPIAYDADLKAKIREDIRSERIVFAAQRVRDVGRSLGLSRLGTLKQPLSWILARVLNRSSA